MKKQKPEIARALLGLACSGVFAVYAFIFSGDAMASRPAEPVLTPIAMPTALDFIVSERRLEKTTRNNRFAATCMRGQILGGSEIHIAMNFAPVDRPATKENPGLARAYAEKINGTEKVLVLESKNPTVWDVTGKPSARFASGCAKKRWVNLPRNWNLPAQQTFMDSLADNLSNRFSRRAEAVSTRMFNRPYASWSVQRGETLMSF